MIGEMNLKPEDVYLAQGTLRPDLIESASHLASGKADVIKTHHNDTELIRKLRDEVRRDVKPPRVLFYVLRHKLHLFPAYSQRYIYIYIFYINVIHVFVSKEQEQALMHC